jgi:hypothetical protein
MALKGDREIHVSDVSFFMNEVAERGGVVMYSTGGSGAALDQGAALVTYAADSSGNVPAGLLLGDMVNKDLTRTHLNFHVDEVQQNSKVALMKRGWVVTDVITGTPTVGQTAYVTDSGVLTATLGAGGLVDTPKVGTFMGSPDEDGYVKVSINLD